MFPCRGRKHDHHVPGEGMCVGLCFRLLRFSERTWQPSRQYFQIGFRLHRRTWQTPVNRSMVVFYQYFRGGYTGDRCASTCVRVCMCVRKPVRTRLNMCACVCVCVSVEPLCVSVCVCVCVCVWGGVCGHVCACACACASASASASASVVRMCGGVLGGMGEACTWERNR
jgi:hypothetical protein